MKQVSFSLFPGQAESFKSKVDPSVQSKILRNYVLNEYQLPEDLSIINEGEKAGLKPEKFLFDEYSDERLNDLVKTIRELGSTANRSSLLRHIMNQLLEKLEKQSDSLPKSERSVIQVFILKKVRRMYLSNLFLS